MNLLQQNKKILMIVESPRKASKIQKMFAGQNVTVLATVGHMMDLPARGLNVAVGTKGRRAGKLILNWQLSDRGKRTAAQLRRAARAADIVVLAADDDREGEAIAAHCIHVLKLAKNAPRIRFNVVTKEAITEAMGSPGRVDTNMVAAQEARRALDRVVGYRVSERLSRSLRGKVPGNWVTIGRVQAPALAAIEDQAQAWQAWEDFRPSSTYQPGSTVEDVFFRLPVDPVPTREEASKIAREHPATKVVKRQERRAKVPPKPPAITIDVLKAFSRAMGSTRPMQLMQELHDAGLITYHRTDSRSLDSGWVRNIRKGLGNDAGDGDPPGGRRVAHAQNAHEAIRPASAIIGMPKAILNMSNDHQRVYQYIASRAVGACMKPGYNRVVKLTLDNNAVATLTKQESKGWRKLSPTDSPKEPNATVWVFKEGQPVDAKGAVAELKVKRPAPPTETWVLGWMEKKKVGRPSTYSATIDRIKKNGMIEKDKKNAKRGFVLTQKGSLTLGAAKDLVPSLLLPTYTEEMEDRLDRIASGAAEQSEPVALVEEGSDLTGQTLPTAAKIEEAVPV